MRILTTIGLLAAAAAAWEIPGRVSFGFAAGAATEDNEDDARPVVSSGYGYFGEVGYEVARWLVAPVAAWGYAYGDAAVRPEEAARFRNGADRVTTSAADLYLAGRFRLPLWGARFNPYASAGVVWSEYHRAVQLGDAVREDRAAWGAGWVADAGAEVFPTVGGSFAVAADYRYAAKDMRWRTGTGELSSVSFDDTEQLITLAVKLYVW